MKTESSHLAINGGDKALPNPPVKRQLFGPEEKAAVMNLFDDALENGCHILGYNGPQEESYCKEFCEFMGGGFADGVNSGTNAVFIALRALELEPYSEVIHSPISDPGGVMPIAMCNLIPVPADSGPDFYNTTAEQIAERITDRTRAILVTHITGRPLDMEPIVALARKHNLYVIEDCAQAHGTVIYRKTEAELCDPCKTSGAIACKGCKAGTFGHLAAFSTMFGKQHASGGQGGLVYTTDQDLYWRVRRHADRGKPFGITMGGGAGAGVGGASGGGANAVAALNCNMDELHATIGRIQLGKLPVMIEQRRKVALQIGAACKDWAGVSLVGDPAWGRSSFWFLFFRFNASAYSVSKEQFVEALAAEGVPCGSSYSYFPSRMIWAQNQQVFGTSGLPWSAVPGTRNPADYPLPNAESVDAMHFLMFINEGWTELDAAAAIEAFSKVDSVFRI